MIDRFSKLVAYLPAIAVSFISYYFLQKGQVVLAAILTSCASILALCAILLSKPSGHNR